MGEWFSRNDVRPVSSDQAPPRDTNEALDALKAAVRDGKHDGLDGDGLRMLVLAYCTHARAEHLTPERMLVRLKHALDEALVATADNPIIREETRTRVVRIAIDAYYDGRA